MNCSTCKEIRQQAEPVAYHVHEADMARMERANKRWFLAWLVTFVLLVGCVAGFTWFELQFEDVVYTVESQTDDGGTAIANATGEVIYNGESQCNGQKENP